MTELFKLIGTIALNNSGAISAMDETTSKGQSMQTKLSSAFSKIGSAAVAAGKVIASGLAVGGTAMVAISKKALDSYAEYEQLVGGVETLFKDSAGKVQQYASQAFQTAGLSANEYMSTVTSFSASLLQSLASDTSASGEMAVEATMEALDKQYEAVQEANDKKVDLLEESHEAEIEAFEELTEQKIALINEQYRENLKLIDEEKYEKIKAIEAQIDALNSQTEAEREAIQKREQEQKKASLEEKVANAKTAEAKLEAEQDLADYLADLEQKEREKQRKAQIEELKAQKEAVEEEADAKKEIVKAQYEAEIELVQKESQAQLKVIKKAQAEELEALKKANKAKLEETAKYIEKQKAMLESSSSAVYTTEVYEQAAEVANRAVIDMSDNANKMGTSMEMIQNAYQGFAKQNYTMLDNLKLGYGGTKEEMERLISDTAKMTDLQKELGITVDDGSLSFANIVNAIHLMQHSMGIAGATQDEAFGTIEGSMKSVGAAWKNLLTGFGDENANLDELITQFTDSAVTALGNAIPRLGTILNGMASTITTMMPIIMANLPGMLEELLPSIIEGATTLFSGLVSVLPTLLQIIIDQVPFILSEIGQALSDAFPVLVETVKGLFGQLLELVGFDSDSASGIVEGLFGAFEKVLPSIMGFMQKLIPIVQNLFAILLPPMVQIVEKVLPLVVQLLGPIMSLIEPIASAIQPIIDCLMALIEPLLEILEIILPPLMVVLDGLCTWLGEYLCNAITYVANLAKNVLGGALNNIKIALENGKKLFSLFIDFFKNVFTGNWEGAWKNICDIFTTLWDNVVSVFKNTVNSILGAVETMINGAIGSLNAFLSGLNKIVETVGDVVGLDWKIPTISEVTLPRLEKGGVLEKGQVGILEGNGAEAVVPLENNRKWIASLADDMQAQGIGGGNEAVALLKEILQLLRSLSDDMPEALVDAIASGLKFDLDKREFARLVHEVG